MSNNMIRIAPMSTHLGTPVPHKLLDRGVHLVHVGLGHRFRIKRALVRRSFVYALVLVRACMIVHCAMIVGVAFCM